MKKAESYLGPWTILNRLKTSQAKKMVFTTFPHDAEQATLILSLAATRAMKEFGDVSNWFTCEAIDKAKEVMIEDDGTFTTKDDEMLGFLLNEDMGEMNISIPDTVQDELKNDHMEIDDDDGSRTTFASFSSHFAHFSPPSGVSTENTTTTVSSTTDPIEFENFKNKLVEMEELFKKHNKKMKD